MKEWLCVVVLEQGHHQTSHTNSISSNHAAGADGNTGRSQASRSGSAGAVLMMQPAKRMP
jgi:hypothetical protein